MELSASIPTFYTLAGVWVAYNVVLYLFQRFISSVPVLTPSLFELLIKKSKSAVQTTNEAYRKYSKNGRLFRYHGLWVTPVSTFSEYRKLGNSTLSLSAAIDDAIYLKFFLGDDNTDVVDFTIKDVTRNIPNLIPGIQEEVRRFWQETFPADADTSDWFERVAQPIILSGIGRIATRVLAGKKYASNAEFTRTASDFANGITYNAVAFFYLPKFLKPFVAKFTPTMRRVNKLKKLIRSDIYGYIADTTAHDNNESKYDEPVILRYLVKYVQAKPGYQGATQEQILSGTVGRFLGLMFAGTDTTTLTTTHTIFDLISQSREEYAEPIMKQVEEVLQKYDGTWTQQALAELTLLDSFIKESQRLHPMSLLFGTRKVMKAGGHTFTPAADSSTSIPLHVPQGQTVMMPVYGVHTDPSVYSDPYTFNGFRYVKEPGVASVPTDHFLSFGHGRHVCPGRHMALCVVKIMVIEFLTTYEWKEMERPQDFHLGPSLSPSYRAKISVKMIKKDGNLI